MGRRCRDVEVQIRGGGRLDALLDAWVEDKMGALRAWAQRERLGYEQREHELMAAQPNRGRGRLGVRIRSQAAERATPGAFSIEWITYRYFTGTNGVFYRTRYIPKGDGDSYPMSAFSGLVRNWQRPLIQEAEENFARIRRAARQIAQVRSQFRAVEKLWGEVEPGLECDG